MPAHVNNPWREGDTPQVRNRAIARHILREVVETLDHFTTTLRSGGTLDQLDPGAAGEMSLAVRTFKAALVAYHRRIMTDRK